MFWLCILVTFYNMATNCGAAPLSQPIFYTNPWPSPVSSYQQQYLMVPYMVIPGISSMQISPVPMTPNLMNIPNSVIKQPETDNTIELKNLLVSKTGLPNDAEGKLPNEPQPMQLPDFQTLAAIRQMQNNALAEAHMSQRWSVGDFINGISWLPIEVNVPDTIMGVYNGISSVIGSWAQRIPFINRITTGVSPRPFKILTIGPDGKPYMVPVNMMPMYYGGMPGYPPPHNNNIIPPLMSDV